MQPQLIDQQTAGQSAPVVMDWEQARFNAGLQLIQNAAGATGAAIEYTLGDPQGSPVWETFQAAQVAGGIFALETPCRAVRLNVTDGTYSLIIIQAGK